MTTSETQPDPPTPPKAPATPELDRQAAIVWSGRSEAVQEFIDWLLDERHYQIAEYLYQSTDPCPGVRRDPFDDSNCEGGRVKQTRTIWSGAKRVGKVLEGETCPQCQGTGEVTSTFANPQLVPVFIQREKLMADFFEIDLNKIEAERRALLDTLREMNS